jgi:dUTP pyrophosphatase
MMAMEIKVHKLHPGATLPVRATQLASGFDLAVLDMVCPTEVKQVYNTGPVSWLVYPGERFLIRTGVSIEIPSGYEGQVRPRSGLALKHGITVVNAPGTIDADYRGDIGVIIQNLGDAPFPVKRGDRIAQLVISPVCHDLSLTEGTLSDTERGDGGYGHTGTR